MICSGAANSPASVLCQAGHARLIFTVCLRIDKFTELICRKAKPNYLRCRQPLKGRVPNCMRSKSKTAGTKIQPFLDAASLVCSF